MATMTPLFTLRLGSLGANRHLDSVYTQSVRWKRKPIWLPTAKSKVFRVPQKPKIPQDEFAEIQRLYNNYRTYMKSIRHYFYEVNKQNLIQLDQSILDKQEEDDYIRCFNINEEWNKKVAELRADRLEKEAEARRLHIFERIEIKKIKETEHIAKVNQKVKEIKLIAPSFITRENIDQAIEEALANVVDYNKAIDLNGEWYTDKSGLPIAKIKAGETSKMNQ